MVRVEDLARAISDETGIDAEKIKQIIDRLVEEDDKQYEESRRVAKLSPKQAWQEGLCSFFEYLVWKHGARNAAARAIFVRLLLRKKVLFPRDMRPFVEKINKGRNCHNFRFPETFRDCVVISIDDDDRSCAGVQVLVVKGEYLKRMAKVGVTDDFGILLSVVNNEQAFTRSEKWV